MLRQDIRARVSRNILFQYPELATLVFGVLVIFLGLGTAWPVLTIYMQEKGIGVGEIGLTVGAWMGANFLFQVPFGWLSDRVGRKPLLVFGLLTNAVISLMFLFVNDMSGFLLLRFLDGVGSAAMMPAARAHIMDTIPSEHRGQAFGTLGSALNVGTLVGPAVGGAMVALTGMTGPFWFGVVSSLIAAAFIGWKLHDRRGEAKVVGTPAEEAEKAIAANKRIVWREVLPVFINSAGGGVAFGLFSVIWNIWMHDLGASLEVIGLTYTAFAIPLVVLGPWAGRLADKRNRMLLILIPSLVNAAIYLSYGFMTNVLLICLLGVLEGTMLVILSPANDSYLADVTPAALRGRMQGISNSANTAVGFISAISCGYLYAINPLLVFVVLTIGICITAVSAAVLMAPVEARLRPPHNSNNTPGREISKAADVRAADEVALAR